MYIYVYVGVVSILAMLYYKFTDFASPLLHDRVKISRHFFIQSEVKTKTTRDSLAPVFFRFSSATCNYLELWLVHWIACVLCDWLE